MASRIKAAYYGADPCVTAVDRYTNARARRATVANRRDPTDTTRLLLDGRQLFVVDRPSFGRHGNGHSTRRGLGVSGVDADAVVGESRR